MTPPVVALHGFTGTPASWQAALPEAETPALLGHDRSAPLHASSCLWSEVDRIAAIARWHAEPGAGVHLVGYSMGARVALALALRHPQLVVHLTLIGVNPGLADEDARRQRQAWEAELRAILDGGDIAGFADAWEALPLWASQRALAPDVLASQRRMRRAHDPRGLAAALAALGLGSMPNLWPMLTSLQPAVHLIAGELDSKFHSLALAIAQHAPRARVSTVSGAGHNPVLETPRELARLIHKAQP